MTQNCKAFCIAASFQMKPLFRYLKELDVSAEIHEGAIFLNLGEGRVFLFPYGSIVFWRVEVNIINEFIAKCKAYADDYLNKIYQESYQISLGEVLKVHQNEIILDPRCGPFEELSISYALAQSVKLAVLEDKVENTISKTDHIPKSLAATGKITLSGKEIAKMMGKLFIDRSSITLRSDVFGTPDFFWDNPKLEPIYLMASHDQEIKQRVEVLNQRLKLINELFQILGDVFNSRHSSTLEIIIIIFIAIEIFLTILFHMIG